MISLLSVFIIAFVAFSVSAVSGGGAGLVLIPVLGQVLSSTQIPVAITIGTATSSLSRIIIFYKNIKWFMVKWIVLASIPGIAIGAYLLSYFDPALLKLALSLFLISNLFLIFKKLSNEPSARVLPNWLLAVVGLTIGLVSSLIGAVGVLFNRIYFRYNLNNEEMIATRAANEVVIHLIKIGVYTWLGIFTSEAITFGGAIAVAAVTSTIIVKRFIECIPKQVFLKVGYTAMVVSGLFMLSDAGNDINNNHTPEFSGEFVADGGEMELLWDGKYYGLKLRLSRCTEFSKLISLTLLNHDTQKMPAGDCYGSEMVTADKIYPFDESEYKAHCGNRQDSHSLSQIIKKFYCKYCQFLNSLSQ